MTEPFEPGDPVGSWLGSDIELMPPRPGGLRRVRRRARRRKAVQAISAGAGAVIVIAAIVAAPQIVSSLQSPAARIAGASGSRPQSSATKAGPSVTPSSPTGPAVGAARPAGPGTALVSGSAIPVPRGFEPGSVTFIGPYHGAVLGQIGPPCRGVCTALAGTSNYGQSWYSFSAPDAGAASGATGVSQVRFLNTLDGWAYGPDLYATHDGGKTWHKISLPGFGRVIDLATAGGEAYAVLGNCSGTGAAYSTGCTSFALFATPAGQDGWAPVTGVSGGGSEVPGGLQLTGARGFLIASGSLYTGPTAGGAWHRVQVAAAGAPPCLSGRAAGSSLLAPGASGGGRLYLACAAAGGGPLTLYISADSGQTWASRGAIAVAGQATSLALAPGGGPLVLATSQGLYYSADYLTWRPATISAAPPGLGFGFVGITTTSGEGVAVPANARLGEIFITADGGRTWHRTPIR